MILQVLNDKHPKLRMVCKPSDPNLAHHRTLARRMLETMDSHKAIGLAANQVFPGELVSIIAIKTSIYKGVMFNPEIIKRGDTTNTVLEGCLSIKDCVKVARPYFVTVKFFTISNEEKTLEFHDLDSHIVQHEIDHLFGKLITDYMILSTDSN